VVPLFERCLCALRTLDARCRDGRDRYRPPGASPPPGDVLKSTVYVTPVALAPDHDRESETAETTPLASASTSGRRRHRC
jgi:hypothetical protein